MKTTWILIAGAMAGALGLALLMWPSAQRASESQSTGCDSLGSARRPVAAAAQARSVPPEVTGQRTEIVSASAGRNGVELPAAALSRGRVLNYRYSPTPNIPIVKGGVFEFGSEQPLSGSPFLFCRAEVI